MNDRKGSKVIRIFDDVSSHQKLKDYVVLEDTWIDGNNKILYNQNNEELVVLGYTVITEEHLMLYSGIKVKFACIKLNKKVNIGDILYTEKKSETMKKYYIKEQEIKIGDEITINGIKTTFTEKLLNDNPNMFKIVNNVNTGMSLMDCVVGETYEYVWDGGDFIPRKELNFRILPPEKTNYNPMKIHKKSLLFITHDGVEIYDENKIIYGCANINNTQYFVGDRKCKHALKEFSEINVDSFIWFSTEKARDNWIRLQIFKIREGYENQLVGLSGEITNLKNYKDKYQVYRWLRKNDPKLYWTKVLLLIADDLNDGEEGNSEICLECNTYVINSGTDIYSPFRFVSAEAGNKAIKIMGDKLDYIYKYLYE
jgi:hypothetical protein